MNKKYLIAIPLIIFIVLAAFMFVTYPVQEDNTIQDEEMTMKEIDLNVVDGVQQKELREVEVMQP